MDLSIAMSYINLLSLFILSYEPLTDNAGRLFFIVRLTVYKIACKPRNFAFGLFVYGIIWGIAVALFPHFYAHLGLFNFTCYCFVVRHTVRHTVYVLYTRLFIAC